MTLKLAWDANGEEDRAVLLDRHTNLLFAIADAIEAAIRDTDKSEAEQRFGRMSAIEISGAMANAVISTLQDRGIGLELFLNDLNSGAEDWGISSLGRS